MVVIIDCRGHLLGRLASTVAKELLNGEHVVAVRTEEINISGSSASSSSSSSLPSLPPFAPLSRPHPSFPLLHVNVFAVARNKIKFQEFLRKRMNTNPTRGPFHFRSPSRIFWRTVRGMVPHKTARGEAALARLKVFEGVPEEFQKSKRMVVPAALRVTHLRPGRDFCTLGPLASEVGWKHAELISKLEAARKVASAAFYQKKKEQAKRINKIKASA